MRRMLRLKLEVFDYVSEQEKPEQYNREFNKQTALEMLVENTPEDNGRLLAALDVALQPLVNFPQKRMP